MQPLKRAPSYVKRERREALRHKIINTPTLAALARRRLGLAENAPLTFSHVDQIIDEQRHEGEFWKNDVYTVKKSVSPKTFEGAPDIIHLSIKRNDGSACRDWRDFQAIKNQLVGEENEAVELYPAESRVVDTANQYHLWVLADPTMHWPVGFTEGLIDNEPDGAVDQRPREK